MNTDHRGPVARLKQSIERLERECKEHQSRHLRAAADFDNYRRRVERDIETHQRAALERLVLDLLPVLDNFDRAVEAATKETAPESLQKGMELIHRQLREALCRHGLQEYSCVGVEFDPRRAEAIGFVNSPDSAPNVVVNESCKGYECNGRVLRPARVLVNKPEQRTQ